MSDAVKLESVTTKTVKIQRELSEHLYDELLDYQAKWNTRPEGFLLGPNEWIALKCLVKNSLFSVTHFGTFDEPRLLGIRLYRMRRPGIDVMPCEAVSQAMTIGLLVKSTDGHSPEEP